jgi:hypothetical protein
MIRILTVAYGGVSYLVSAVLFSSAFLPESTGVSPPGRSRWERLERWRFCLASAPCPKRRARPGGTFLFRA